VFTDSNLQEVDFGDCDLKASVFDNCDLQNAIFENTDLRSTDFRKARNFSFDPEKNQLKGAKFTIDSLPGLLTKYNLKIE
jgi:uncharacterized protein YjbI with pentapeptide repeats